MPRDLASHSPSHTYSDAAAKCSSTAIMAPQRNMPRRLCMNSLCLNRQTERVRALYSYRMRRRKEQTYRCTVAIFRQYTFSVESLLLREKMYLINMLQQYSDIFALHINILYCCNILTYTFSRSNRLLTENIAVEIMQQYSDMFALHINVKCVQYFP